MIVYAVRRADGKYFGAEDSQTWFIKIPSYGTDMGHMVRFYTTAAPAKSLVTRFNKESPGAVHLVTFELTEVKS